MLTGQNNGEKDVLRAFYRGLVKHFSQTVKVKEELTEFNMQKYIKEIRKTDTSNDLVWSITLLTTIYLALTRQFQGLIRYRVDRFADVSIFIAYLVLSKS